VLQYVNAAHAAVLVYHNVTTLKYLAILTQPTEALALQFFPLFVTGFPLIF
jgi:hypothetical protein